MITNKEICQAIDKNQICKVEVVKVARNDCKTEEWDTNKNMCIQLVRTKS